MRIGICKLSWSLIFVLTKVVRYKNQQILRGGSVGVYFGVKVLLPSFLFPLIYNPSLLPLLQLARDTGLLPGCLRKCRGIMPIRITVYSGPVRGDGERWGSSVSNIAQIPKGVSKGRTATTINTVTWYVIAFHSARRMENSFSLTQDIYPQWQQKERHS